MIEEFQIKEIKIFADFSNCAVGEVLKVFKQDNSSDLELLIESRSNNHLNFYKTCKPFSCNTFFQEKGDKNPLKKISEVCYLSQDYLNNLVKDNTLQKFSSEDFYLPFLEKKYCMKKVCRFYKN